MSAWCPSSKQAQIMTPPPPCLTVVLSDVSMLAPVDSNLASSEKVKDLGIILDQDMSSKSFIKQVIRISFFHL